MFKALLKLAQQGDLNLAVRATQGENPTMTIVVMPVGKQGQDPALATPVRLVGTLTEIEEGFADAIDRFTGTRATLIEQLEATETILKNAQAAAAKKGTDALKGKAKASAPVTVKAPAASAAASKPEAEETDDDGGDDDDLPTGGTPAPQAAASTESAPESANLFGM